MAIQLVSVRAAAKKNGIKVLVYGAAGAGKTRLVSTAPNPVLISAEGGILSLSDVETDFPIIEISTMEDCIEAYQWALHSAESDQFDWICVDSISEIAEKCLAGEKKSSSDPRQAYGALQDTMYDMIRSFRDLPGRNVYMSAKAEKYKDDDGKILWQPSMPGAKLSGALPYFFDEVFPLRVEKDADSGEPYRVLQTGRDWQYEAKDRSGKLDMWEPADLAHVAKKILGERTADVTVQQPEYTDETTETETEE